MNASTPRIKVTKPLMLAIAVGLSIAALAAIFAIFTEDAYDAAGRVFGIALGFVVYSATGAAGAALLRREYGAVQALGFLTMALSAVSFVVFTVTALSDIDLEGNLMATLALLTFAFAHASFVWRRARETDGVAVFALGSISIVLTLTVVTVALLLLHGAIEDPSTDFYKFAGTALILALLTTALTPILRRLTQ